MAKLSVEISQVADQLRLALLGRLLREPGIDQGVRLVVVEPAVRAPVERYEQEARDCSARTAGSIFWITTS